MIFYLDAWSLHKAYQTLFTVLQKFRVLNTFDEAEESMLRFACVLLMLWKSTQSPNALPSTSKLLPATTPCCQTLLYAHCGWRPLDLRAEDLPHMRLRSTMNPLATSSARRCCFRFSELFMVAHILNALPAPARWPEKSKGRLGKHLVHRDVWLHVVRWDHALLQARHEVRLLCALTTCKV